MLIETHAMVAVLDLTDSQHHGYLQIDKYMQLGFNAPGLVRGNGICSTSYSFKLRVLRPNRPQPVSPKNLVVKLALRIHSCTLRP